MEINHELGKLTIPWSEHYTETKFAYIKGLTTDPGILEKFQNRNYLPDGYGVGIDERCIEYAWFFANLPKEAVTILDAGSALNHEAVIDHPSLHGKNLHISTLAPEGNCFWKKGISYLFSDLRSFPIRDNFYDCIVSISTLEHVGMNNFGHTGQEQHRQQQPGDYMIAVKELWRTLRPGGTLLITLPFGVYTNMGFALQFDSLTLQNLTETIDYQRLEKYFYRYSIQGWQIDSEEGCSDCVYVEWLADFFGDPGRPFPSQVPLEKDFAAAARAVACLKLTKDRKS